MNKNINIENLNLSEVPEDGGRIGLDITLLEKEYEKPKYRRTWSLVDGSLQSVVDYVCQKTEYCCRLEEGKYATSHLVVDTGDPNNIKFELDVDIRAPRGGDKVVGTSKVTPEYKSLKLNDFDNLFTSAGLATHLRKMRRYIREEEYQSVRKAMLEFNQKVEIAVKDYNDESGRRAISWEGKLRGEWKHSFNVQLNPFDAFGAPTVDWLVHIRVEFTKDSQNPVQFFLDCPAADRELPTLAKDMVDRHINTIITAVEAKKLSLFPIIFK